MKTGRNTNNRILPEIFYIILLVLDGILKRCGFKDCVLFKEHNPQYQFNSDLFDSGICFNLFSEYGVGKKLENMIKELIKNSTLDPEKYENNIFYEEIVNLSPEISILIRKENTTEEINWVQNYAIKNLNKSDKIALERIKRLYILSKSKDKGKKDEDEDEDEDEINDSEFCNCNFCEEFRKFHYPRNKHIDKIILEVLIELDKED